MAWGMNLALGQAVDFESQIKPLPSDRCFACHGPDANHRKADLRFDTHEGALADLGGHAAVVPGLPDKSELIARIHTCLLYTSPSPRDS